MLESQNLFAIKHCVLYNLLLWFVRIYYAVALFEIHTHLLLPHIFEISIIRCSACNSHHKRKFTNIELLDATRTNRHHSMFYDRYPM